MWAARDQLEKDSFQTDLAAGFSKYQPKGRDGEGRFMGLHIKPEIVKKIYVDNPRKWLKLPNAGAKKVEDTPPADATTPTTPTTTTPTTPATPAKP
jgi:hypothetical protein